MNKVNSKPIIGITMGDAAGVGPEIILKSLQHSEMHDICRPVIIGDMSMLERAKTFVGSEVPVRAITEDELTDLAEDSGTVYCLDLDLLPADLPVGKVSPEAGHAAFEYLATAIR